jgi:hypothetical protein
VALAHITGADQTYAEWLHVRVSSSSPREFLEYLDHFDKQVLIHLFMPAFSKLSKTFDFQTIKNN